MQQRKQLNLPRQSCAYLIDVFFVSLHGVVYASAAIPWQCSDYMNGVVGGSLCEPLCVRKEVEFVRCLGHGVKMHVLEARWAANTVVLKTSKPLGHRRATAHLETPDKFTRKITKQEFITEVSMASLS